MEVVTRTIQINSGGENDVIDITQQLSNMVKESNIEKGIVIIFVSGSTAGITTIEYEPGLIHDFPAMLSRICTKKYRI